MASTTQVTSPGLASSKSAKKASTKAFLGEGRALGPRTLEEKGLLALHEIFGPPPPKIPDEQLLNYDDIKSPSKEEQARFEKAVKAHLSSGQPSHSPLHQCNESTEQASHHQSSLNSSPPNQQAPNIALILTAFALVLFSTRFLYFLSPSCLSFTFFV
eukprot:TRINITY_DN10328_c0_g1_i1.p1 TRINITY_DN10328_c0_g1~~TRINITY_DN10328_c0_g1_i1.p1  ORF type:complete len:183 (-),score=45.85 TRINITY_DN10328_c0_g1_i1:142-615(-)